MLGKIVDHVVNHIDKRLNHHQSENQGLGQNEGWQQAEGTHGHTHKSYQHHIDRNQVNQADEQYRSLRDRANVEGDEMAKAFQGSHDAYDNGDGARAKELSNEGKAHERRMEEFNREAAEWIYIENNRGMPKTEVNLHGLYVKEAINYTERAIQDAQGRGDHTLELVVGKGIHSPHHIPKIKPAIEELMQKYQLVAELEPHNAGVLLVHLDGREGSGRKVGVDDITQKLEKGQDGCLIM